MLKDGVYVLKQDATVYEDLKFPKDQEIEIVNKVVYIGGYYLPPGLQSKVITWMENNKELLMTDNRNF